MKYFWYVLFILLIIGGIVTFTEREHGDAVVIPDTATSTPATTMNATSSNPQVTLKSVDYTYVLADPKRPAPDLARALVYGLAVDPQTKQLVDQRRANLVAALTKNPKDITSWIGFGQLYEMIDDFAAARDVWDYLTKLQPSNSVPLQNMANLCGYYVNDKPCARTYYGLALAANEYNPQTAAVGNMA